MNFFQRKYYTSKFVKMNSPAALQRELERISTLSEEQKQREIAALQARLHEIKQEKKNRDKAAWEQLKKDLKQWKQQKKATKTEKHQAKILNNLNKNKRRRD